MLNRLFRYAYRHSGLPYRWSHTAEDYYPIKPQPRWGEGRPPYTRLRAILDSRRADYACFLSDIDIPLFRSIAHESQESAPHEPYWNSTWFTGFDAVALMTMIATRQPTRYIEIGSGQSTRFVRYAINAKRLDTHVSSIDPAPRQEINALCDQITRTRLEECDLALFDTLDAGDILFFDGSHRVFTNSDVTVFFFELLPRLKPGVIVHIHDIFIPDDYPTDWNRRYYNEQYLLAAMLLADAPFRVLLPCAFVCRDADLGPKVSSLFAQTGIKPRGGAKSASFWVETYAK